MVKSPLCQNSLRAVCTLQLYPIRHTQYDRLSQQQLGFLFVYC